MISPSPGAQQITAQLQAVTTVIRVVFTRLDGTFKMGLGALMDPLGLLATGSLPARA
jgi:hypothetical protein